MDFIQAFGQQFIHFWNKPKDFSWLAWLWAGIISIFGWYLNQIGYNAKPIVGFILFLFVSDFITRILAEIINAGGLYKAFVEKKTISSKKFSVGFFVKFVGYTFVLVSAYKLENLEVMYGLNTIISSFLYASLVIADLISNFENLRDMGFAPASFILMRLKKEKEKLGVEEESGGDG